MKSWTYLEIRTKVARDIDVQDEPFVQTDEMIDYCNDAIEEAEAEICKIAEDYFLTDPATVTAIVGQQEYDLPADIYIQKIRQVIFKNGSIVYPITKLRGMYHFLEEELIETFGPLEYYQYRIVSPSPNVYKLKIYPALREAGPVIKIQYLRSAARIPTLASGASQATIDATLVDIPEFSQFIMQYMKAKIRAKENMGQMNPEDAALVEHERKMMVDTLTERVPDDDNVVIGDYSSYWEHN